MNTWVEESLEHSYQGQAESVASAYLCFDWGTKHPPMQQNGKAHDTLNRSLILNPFGQPSHTCSQAWPPPVTTATEINSKDLTPC